MFKYLVRTFVSIVFFLGSVFTSYAANSFYLFIDGIQGESKAVRGAIDIENFSFRITNPSAFSTTGTRIGKASFSSIQLGKTLDKTSPTLFLKLAQGASVKKVIIKCFNSLGDRSFEFYSITLENVFISSVTQSANLTNPVAENIDLEFGRISWTYNVQNIDGSKGETVTNGWDVTENKAF